MSCCGGCPKMESCQREFLRLSDLNIGESGVIVSIAGDDENRFRIMEMGLIAKTRVKVIKKSPFGDHISIGVRGYELSLRKNEAEMVIVNRVV